MIRLPVTTRGRRGVDAQRRYDRELRAFCEAVQEIRSRLDFAPSARGWCYILEEHGLRKGDFGRAERLLTVCRKLGHLPLEITAEDDARETIGLIETHDNSPREYARWILEAGVDLI